MRMRDPALARASEDERQAIAHLDTLFRGLSRGEWTSFVANRLPVLRLPAPLLDAVREGRLDYTKAIALRRAPEKLREALLADSDTLSVQQIRQRIQEAGRVGAPHEDLDGALETFRRLTAKDRLAGLTPEARGELLSLLKQATSIMVDRTDAPSRKRLR
ncbi:hypothetical protein [Deinococcus aquaticus]